MGVLREVGGWRRVMDGDVKCECECGYFQDKFWVLSLYIERERE